MNANIVVAVVILVLLPFTVKEILSQKCDETDCLTIDRCRTSNVCRTLQCDSFLLKICGHNAQCVATNHSVACFCPVGYNGNPFKRCLPSGCVGDVDCDSNRACFRDKCLDPCQFVTCGLNTICHASNHRATCSCPIGSTWNPVTGCQRLDKPECITNMNCALEDVCQDNKCQDPCRTASCGANTVCVTRNHTPMCYCRTGYVGNADTGCVENKTYMKRKKFKVFDNQEVTWQEAVNHCNSLGMKLATINNQEEQDAVYNMTSSYGAWLGGSDMGDTGNYTWRSTNTIITYSNWALGEPNSRKWPGSDNDKDHCIIISSAGKWWHWPCNTNWYCVICEYYD